MNDIFNEVFGGRDTTKLTPIEIALGIDNEGRTTAKKLYEYLELNPGNFARWCKTNISDNKFAEAGADYWRLFFEEETPTGGKIQREDFKLTASFAKKLSMVSKSPKGEAARDYFVGVENGAKKLIEKQVRKVPLTEHPGEVANYLKQMDRRMEKEGVAPYKIAEAFKMVSEQFGIRLPDDFVKVPEYEQMKLSV